MRSHSILFVVALIVAASTARGDTDGRLLIQAQAAIVEIDPLPAGRRLILLPTLEFVLTIEPQCAASASTKSISVSVADTRKTFRATDFAEQSSIAMTLKIPRRQVGPLAIERFCQQGESADSTPQILLVRDALTAHFALRCADGDKQSIVYATLPLDVSLLCKAANNNDTDSSTDQGSSSSITRLKSKNPSVRFQAFSASSAS